MTEPLPSCRSCGNTNLQPVLSLGRMPLANALLTPKQLNEPELAYPLDLAICPNCTLVQITVTVPPEKLFAHYRYFSSYSVTMMEESKELARRLAVSCCLNAKSLVVELGSNDGYQLQSFAQSGIPVLGIDPAENVARVAVAKGIPTICEFFGARLARELRHKSVCGDVIIAKNVLAHVADLNGFVEGIRILLKDNGRAIIEVPYVKDLIDRREFDTIYHEHLCYFSVTALDQLFRRHRMVLREVERIPLHGGSLRLHVAHVGDGPDQSVRTLLQEELDWGANRVGSYLEFASQVEKIRVSLRQLLESLKQMGKHIAAYGAAAKGTVLLNYCGIDGSLVDFVVDVSPHKQGCYMPGVHLPICPPSRLLDDMPDYTLLLAWNIADEVVRQQDGYVSRGGRFIIPIPDPKVMDSAKDVGGRWSRQ